MHVGPESQAWYGVLVVACYGLGAILISIHTGSFAPPTLGPGDDAVHGVAVGCGRGGRGAWLGAALEPGHIDKHTAISLAETRISPPPKSCQIPGVPSRVSD